MRLLLFFTLIFSIGVSWGQSNYDTLTFFQYNLGRYNTPQTNCTVISLTEKNRYLDTIFSNILPDVIMVQEMANELASAELLLKKALNHEKRDYYKSASFTASAADLNNMLYYNGNKLKLLSQRLISCVPRQVNVYTLQHLNTNVVFTIIVAHLKSSQTNNDILQRSVCAQAIMNFLQSNFTSTANIFVAGDFNIYSTEEDAYKVFTTYENPVINLYDPVYVNLKWNESDNKYVYESENTAVPKGVFNNQELAMFHTQSPLMLQKNCLVGGGLDDRFDYILFNRTVLDDSLGINFIPGSYQVVGNDGLHFNKALDDGENNSVSPELLNALVNNSDHLPVVAKFRFRNLLSVPTAGVVSDCEIKLMNQDKLSLSLHNGCETIHEKEVIIQIIDMQGRIILDGSNKASDAVLKLPSLSNGIYLVKVINKNKVFAKKIAVLN